MPNHLDSYLEITGKISQDIVNSVNQTVEKIVPEHIASFSHKEHIKGLLLGQVQSGKTGQMFGIIAASADVDDAFSIFILLTSDISALQQQTYKRALESMDTFNVCDEHDDMRFLTTGKRKPSLIILKKNSLILKKWKDILASSGQCKGRPIFVVDDEADSASLNTLINKKEQSAINNHLQGILELSTSSFYLQVTATPQSLLLQTEESKWKPSFVHYFPPGKRYLGGDFFYTKPKPFTNIITADDELNILLKEEYIADGLKRAIYSYLITCSNIAITKSSNSCNFLVHPSNRISDHEKIKEKVIKQLQFVFGNLESEEVQKQLEIAWDDLKRSKPDLKSFGEISRHLQSMPEIAVYTMNSGPESNSRLSFDEGNCIIIGGNSLGRGVTFKSLQTVYYCRSSKYPQADTFWQHCRMFGYDRDPLLMRVFMPEALFNMFYEINVSNETLISQIEQGRFDQLQIITSGKIKPTRKNVIDQKRYDYIVGGVNYFPPVPDQTNAREMDEVLSGYDDERNMHDVTIEEAIRILNTNKSDDNLQWSIPAFINALYATKDQRDSLDLVKLIVRRDRNITKGTGTLLSADDRRFGNDIKNIPVITLYRLNGQSEKGWNGKPFWVPNIKMPEGKIYHRVV